MIASSYPLLDLFWTILWIFGFIIWIWLLIMIFGDIFRSQTWVAGRRRSGRSS